MILSKPVAFLKKDFQIEISYRFAFFLQFGGIFFSVVMFYFVSELIGDAPNVQQSLSEYGGNYFSVSPRIDPTGPASGEGRVGRGGCWNSHQRDCRTAFRFGFVPNARSHAIGFRLCRWDDA